MRKVRDVDGFEFSALKTFSRIPVYWEAPIRNTLRIGEMEQIQ
jgi:hypothetical protein